MNTDTIPREKRLAREYFDALKEIASFTPLERLQRVAATKYGLDAPDAVGMAYENVVELAKYAIKGRRRP